MQIHLLSEGIGLNAFVRIGPGVAGFDPGRFSLLCSAGAILQATPYVTRECYELLVAKK